MHGSVSGPQGDSPVITSAAADHGMDNGSPRFDDINLTSGSSHVCFIDTQRADVNRYTLVNKSERWNSSQMNWR